MATPWSSTRFTAPCLVTLAAHFRFVSSRIPNVDIPDLHSEAAEGSSTSVLLEIPSLPIHGSSGALAVQMRKSLMRGGVKLKKEGFSSELFKSWTR